MWFPVAAMCLLCAHPLAICRARGWHVGAHGASSWPTSTSCPEDLVLSLDAPPNPGSVSVQRVLNQTLSFRHLRAYGPRSPCPSGKEPRSC